MAADLHAADAVYHVNCYQAFSKIGTQLPDACRYLPTIDQFLT